MPIPIPPFGTCFAIHGYRFRRANSWTTLRAGDSIALSTISLAEIIYLIEKDRLPESAYHELTAALQSADYVLDETPLTADIVDAMRRVPRSDVPDLPDRIVAATAVHFGVPVISRDRRIRAAALDTIW